GRRVQHQGAGHGGHGPGGPGDGDAGTGSGDSGAARRDPQGGGDVDGDVPQDAGQGRSGRQRRAAAARGRARADRAWTGVGEGGRHKAFFPGYRPQFYSRTMDVTGEITLPEGVEMVMPGDNVNLHVKLITPVALEEGGRFAIREGGLTVGAGVITKILD